MKKSHSSDDHQDKKAKCYGAPHFLCYQRAGIECKNCSIEIMEKIGIPYNNRGAFKVYCGYYKLHDAESSLDEFNECYIGYYTSRSEFCKEVYGKNVEKLTDELSGSIDWKSAWHDCWNKYAKHDYMYINNMVFKGKCEV